MTDLDPRLLALGQPELDDGDASLGVAIGIWLGTTLWCVICVLAWLFVGRFL